VTGRALERVRAGRRRETYRLGHGRLATAQGGGTLGGILVGTSVYQCDHWSGVLYPEGLPRDRWLARRAETSGTKTAAGHSGRYGRRALRAEADARLRWRRRGDARACFIDDPCGAAVGGALELAALLPDSGRASRGRSGRVETGSP